MEIKIRDFLNKKRKWYQDAGISILCLLGALIIYRVLGYLFVRVTFLTWKTILGVVLLYTIGLFGWRYWQVKEKLR
ncbi:hypothetical protein ACLJJ6_01735 [Pediococcus siamensis]|uniref:hypothetical protein n=1 Tax=Pediococcus siamensis TaxID=381829 RepID=UPI0039A04A05